MITGSHYSMNHQGYKVLSEPVTTEFEQKRSRFLAFLFPVQSRDAAMQQLRQLSSRYPDARHHCWAYLLGDPHQTRTQALNDDGEPSGTAGKPMLHVLTQRGCGDTLAVVVRYFGGIKLGTGGLVRAYSTAVSKAVDQATFCEPRPLITVEVTVAFALESQIRRLIEEYDGDIGDVQYANQVIIMCRLESSRHSQFAIDIQQLTWGQATLKTSTE